MQRNSNCNQPSAPQLHNLDVDQEPLDIPHSHNCRKPSSDIETTNSEDDQAATENSTNKCYKGAIIRTVS